MGFEEEISAAENFLESQKVSGMFVVGETKGISCVVGEKGLDKLHHHLFRDYTVEYLLARRSKETEFWKIIPKKDKRNVFDYSPYHSQLQLPTIAVIDIQSKDARRYLIAETHPAWSGCYGFWYFAHGDSKGGFSNKQIFSPNEQEFLKKLEQDFLENYRNVIGEISDALLVR